MEKNIMEKYKLFILKNEYNKHNNMIKSIEKNINYLFMNIIIENEVYLIYNLKIQQLIKNINKLYNDYYRLYNKWGKFQNIPNYLYENVNLII